MTSSFPGVLTRASFSFGAARSRAGANFGLGPTKIQAPHEQRQRAEHGLPGENQHGAMVPFAHHASPTACVAGSSPPSTCPACPQPGGDPRPRIPAAFEQCCTIPGSPRTSHLHAQVWHRTSRHDGLPLPSSRSDIQDALFVPEPVCCHRAPILRVCCPFGLISGHVLPVRALLCVALCVRLTV